MLTLLATGFLAGATLLYLCHQNQGWIEKPLARVWGWLGSLMLVTTLVMACARYPLNTAILAWLAALMLVWGALPFVPLVRVVKKREH
ncbi:hypothetical protein [Microbulbifer aggregans]|uniref:hypothetical protein n=1 Tax=Microbulbifer aggregans TaxID=1769779 RepID=UPI001CFEB3E7|nr:hypothetical protein [Microbulbifer aggregans]